MTEDFVTFEIAEKLQEKGFDWQTFDWYDHLGNFNKGFIPRTLRGCPVHREYYAPTIGLAIKWLREEKKRFVVIHPTGHDVHYYYTVHNLARSFDTFEYTQSFATYEEAAIAGIEYCLDNLI